MRPARIKGLLLACLLSACTLAPREPLPNLMPAALGAPQTSRACAALFPRGRWQLVHAIAFHLADGSSGNALGVVLLNGRHINCALMTVEGLTLFEARSAGPEDLEVVRALPPFASRDLAAGLMADLRTLFQPPPGSVEYGRLADGRPVCRSLAGREATDLLPQPDGCWQLHTYSDQRRTRTVTADACEPARADVLPRTLVLTASGPAGYTLNLRLISAEPLPAAR